MLAFFLGKAGILNAKMMANNRRVAILLIFVVAAVVTPPDVVSQILLSIPLYGLFEISILIVRMIDRKREKALKKQG